MKTIKSKNVEKSKFEKTLKNVKKVHMYIFTYILASNRNVKKKKKTKQSKIK